jgi:SHS2 domain-containing protein
MSSPPWEILSHTADLRLRVSGSSPQDLYANAARALCDLLCDVDTVEPRVERRLQVTAGHAPTAASIATPAARPTTTQSAAAPDLPIALVATASIAPAAPTATDELLVRFLSELIYLFEVEGLLLPQVVELSFVSGGLRARLRGEPFDGSRHEARHAVKAATYHRLELRQEETGWVAEVVLDV